MAAAGTVTIPIMAMMANSRIMITDRLRVSMIILFIVFCLSCNLFDALT